jgi:hypothetical protein
LDRCRCPCGGPGLEALQRLVLEQQHGADPVSAIAATGGLHQVWVRGWIGGPRVGALFARPETTAARAQLARVGSRPTTGTATYTGLLLADTAVPPC